MTSNNGIEQFGQGKLQRGTNGKSWTCLQVLDSRNFPREKGSFNQDEMYHDDDYKQSNENVRAMVTNAIGPYQELLGNGKNKEIKMVWTHHVC